MIFAGLLGDKLRSGWESLKEAITPESHAESVVNEIYSPENRGMTGLPGFSPTPVYKPTLAKVPQAAVTTIEIVGGTIDKATSSIRNNFTKWIIYAFIGLVILIFVNSFARGMFR